MNRKELIEKSIFIITEYYNGNLKPYFDALADTVLWIGPRSGQILRGKDTMIRVWEDAEASTWFTLSGISAETVSTGRNNLEVLLEYYVYTHFHDGTVDQHHQRFHLSWGNTAGKDQPEIFMVHISNIAEGGDFDGKVYASTPAESRIDSTKRNNQDTHEKTVSVKGPNDTTLFFQPSSVIWIESTDNARHAVIHTPEQNYLSYETTRSLERKFEGYLLRCHASYLINPLYVTDLKRFTVTMSDNASLPVPEKKYTAFKKSLREWSSRT